jgi:hypothetical protein
VTHRLVGGRPALAGAIACALASIVLGGCASVSGDRPTSAQSVALRLPLATSRRGDETGTAVAAAGGPLWAFVPMSAGGTSAGSWQVLEMPNPGAPWSLVTPKGVADTGGLVGSFLGSGGVIGVEPSGFLGYSPVAATADDGVGWSPGILPGPLAPVPDALATASDGRVLALLGRSGTSVVESDDNAASSTAMIASRPEVALAGGQSCHLSALTAVDFAPGGDPVVAGRCLASAHIGIFELTARGWKFVGPPAPTAALLEGVPPHSSPLAVAESAASRSVVTQVLRLATEGPKLVALVEAVASDGTASLFRITEGASGHWSATPVFDVAPSQRLVATGNEPDGATFILVSRSGSLAAEVLSASGSSWLELPAPPAGTATLAFTTAGVTEALAVDGSAIRVFGLDASHRWSFVQVVKVPH